VLSIVERRGSVGAPNGHCRTIVERRGVSGRPMGTAVPSWNVGECRGGGAGAQGTLDRWNRPLYRHTAVYRYHGHRAKT
jgi:hypothetical protein